MQNILLIFTIFTLVSCNKEISLNNQNHLVLFNLKGKVKQINYNYYLSEITDGSYKPIGKTNAGFLYEISDIDVANINVLSNFNIFVSDLSFDSYNLFLREISFQSNYSTECDNFEVLFNDNGYVTNFKGFKNNKLNTQTIFTYTGKNLTKIKKNEGLDPDGNNYEIDINYNSLNLIKSKSLTDRKSVV